MASEQGHTLVGDEGINFEWDPRHRINNPEEHDDDSQDDNIYVFYEQDDVGSLAYDKEETCVEDPEGDPHETQGNTNVLPEANVHIAQIPDDQSDVKDDEFLTIPHINQGAEATHNQPIEEDQGANMIIRKDATNSPHSPEPNITAIIDETTNVDHEEDTSESVGIPDNCDLPQRGNSRYRMRPNPKPTQHPGFRYDDGYPSIRNHMRDVILRLRFLTKIFTIFNYNV